MRVYRVLIFVLLAIFTIGCNTPTHEDIVLENNTTPCIEEVSLDTPKQENLVVCNTEDDEDSKEMSIEEIDESNFNEDFIANFSLEAPDEENILCPTKWTNSSWGDLEVEFSYLNEGHFGDHSVKTVITEHTKGDAKWFFDFIELIPNEEYNFVNYYKSDVETYVILTVTDKFGKKKYIDLGSTKANESWTRYEASFFMPSYAVSATMYHIINQEGYLIVDDYQITHIEHEGFDKGMVTITFDDGWEVNTKTALPIMQEMDFKSNQYYATTFIANPITPNPKELIQEFIDAGHEIGSHTINHPKLTSLTQEELTKELKDSKSFLEFYLDTDINYFAAPFGDYNCCVNDCIMKYYDTHRTVDFGYNSKTNLDISCLKCLPVLSKTSLEEVEGWINKAQQENLWLILLYHKVEDNPYYFGTKTSNFKKQMKLIKEYDMPVVTISEALDYLNNEY